MKKLFTIISALILTIPVFSQTVEVSLYNAKVLDDRLPGYRTKLHSDADKVERFLKRTLRDMGKMRERNTYYQVTNMDFRGVSFDERVFYAQLIDHGDYQTVWFGADTTNLESSANRLLEGIESFTYSFGIDYYKSLVQEEIDESEKAEEYILKSQNRLNRDSISLQNKLVSNERELIRLQEAIEANKKEHEALLKMIETNKVEIDSAIVDLEGIRRTLAIQRKKKEGIK